MNTLVLQGATLRWLASRVTIPFDNMVEREIGIARALRAIFFCAGGKQSAGSPAANPRLRSYSGRAVSAKGRPSATPGRNVIGAVAFQALEEEPDVLELMADPMPQSVVPAQKSAWFAQKPPPFKNILALRGKGRLAPERRRAHTTRPLNPKPCRIPG